MKLLAIKSKAPRNFVLLKHFRQIYLWYCNLSQYLDKLIICYGRIN